MKNLLIICSIFLIISCNKDDNTTQPSVYQEENPFQALLTKNGYTNVSLQLDRPNNEFGFSFKTLVKGNINSLVIKIPTSSPSNIRVTLWDFTTKTILKTEYVEVFNTGATTKIITPIPLESNKQYMLTMNSNQWYDYFEANDAVILYPSTFGNIVYTNFYYKETDNQIFPLNISDTVISGDLSFNFQQTE